MAKDADEALARWRDADARYRELVDAVVAAHGVLSKDEAVELSRAAAKADKRRDQFLKVVLKKPLKG